MKFKALRIVSESEVELTFEGDDGIPVVHVLSVKSAGQPFDDPDFMLVNGCEVFWDHQKLIMEFAAAARRVARRTFPAGDAVKRLEAEAKEARAARKAEWDATH